MDKPKHDEIKNIDYWVCCWCDKKVKDTNDLDLHMPKNFADCPHCGKKNEVNFSIEYSSYPVVDE